MRYLFFFVHPSKFHVFRQTINTLLKNGHHVDVIITSKDVLEELIKDEGWNYTNIFPEGRKMKGVPAYISSGINFFRTIFRLYWLTKDKQYDLFVTDDLLVYIGKLKKVPTIVFNDDDLDVVKQYSLVLSKADRILAPDITRLARFEKKKIAFPGYKELAYLHPNVFKPDIDVVKKFNPDLKPYFILRLVSLRAYHDVGMKGLSDKNVLRLISILEKYGQVYITAERPLTNNFKKHRLNIQPSKIAHAIYYAEAFIGDSQTMTSEAAVLGTPAFRCNDFVGRISVMEEKEKVYGLTHNYLPSKFDEMLVKIEELLNTKDFKLIYKNRREKMLDDKIDLSAFMYELFLNFNKSTIFKDEDFDKYKRHK